MSNILDIHIHRVSAGQIIPFDKVYLFRPEDKELVPKIFGYGIVLPLSQDIKDAIYTLRPASLTRKHFYRNDDHKAIPATINDTPIAGNKHTANEIKTWWEEFAQEPSIELDKRLVVIPVLTSIARRKIRPRYLANQKWFQNNVQRNTKKKLPMAEGPVGPLSEWAYLATPQPAPNDKIRPLCTICPRMLLHVQGECVPGQPVCYDSLNFADIQGDSTDARVQQNND